MVNRLPHMRNDIILHQWKGCHATCVDGALLSDRSVNMLGCRNSTVHRNVCALSDSKLHNKNRELFNSDRVSIGESRECVFRS
jgi:hypothetical protein